MKTSKISFNQSLWSYSIQFIQFIIHLFIKRSRLIFTNSLYQKKTKRNKLKKFSHSYWFFRWPLMGYRTWKYLTYMRLCNMYKKNKQNKTADRKYVCSLCYLMKSRSNFIRVENVHRDHNIWNALSLAVCELF